MLSEAELTYTIKNYTINTVLSSALVRICLIFLIENKTSFNRLYVLGPNELSIVDVELIPFIFGPQGLPKGPSKINLYINTIFAYLVSFTSVGRKTFTNVTE